MYFFLAFSESARKSNPRHQHTDYFKPQDIEILNFENIAKKKKNHT